MSNMARYTVISADCHGGAALHQYREYLESSYHDDFDRWAATYETPYEDMKGEDGSRNWDSARRIDDLEADGIAAEVLFPNTVPPFFSRSSLASSQNAVDGADNFDRRWAGLRAHNRWLAEFCAAAKGRRAGVFQVILHDIEKAVEEVRWAGRAGLTGGLLLPGAPPGSGLPPIFYHEYYDPLWAVCAELGIPVNCHGGSAGPRTGDRQKDDMFFLLDMKWWDEQRLRHLILGGVLERHPGLRVVFTESGVMWIPRELKKLDRLFDSMRGANGDEEVAYDASSAVDDLTMKPSEYWRRQCYVGATFMHPAETESREYVGVDKIMWGSDYPHYEASFPFSKAAIRYSLAGLGAGEAEQMLAGNAAHLYGFSLDDLQSIGDRVGPGQDEVRDGIDPATLPPEAAKCPAFAGSMPGSARTRMGDNRKIQPR